MLANLYRLYDVPPANSLSADVLITSQERAVLARLYRLQQSADQLMYSSPRKRALCLPSFTD